MALSSLTGNALMSLKWNAQQNLPSSGFNLPPVGNTSAFNKNISYSTGGNVANGANEFCGFFQTVAPSGTATINLQNLTDILQYPSIALVRMKSILLWLLAVADDSTNGTACSSVTIGNAASNANPLFMTVATSTFPLGNGDAICYATGSAAGITVDASHLNIKIANNDVAVAACVLVGIFGATS